MKGTIIRHIVSCLCGNSKVRPGAVLAAILLCGSIQVLEAADAKATAETLLSFEGLRPGLCVHIGGTDGELSAELAVAGKYHVHCLTSDRTSVEKMQQYAASKGLYGQVVVDHNSLKDLPYPNHLVNVLVVEDFPALQKKGLTVKELMRVVAPKNAALLGNAPANLKELITQAGYKDAIIHEKGLWTQIIKPRPEEMDDWPEHYHDSGSSSTSGDLLVQKPNSLQWIAGDLTQHEAGPSSMIMMNGRIFSLFDQKIVARDAFNGLKLWEKKGGPGKGGAFDCWIATKDQLFTVLQKGGPSVALDAGTGKTIKTYDFSPSKLSYHDGILLAIAQDGTLQAHEVTSGQKLWGKQIKGLSGSSRDSFNMKSFSALSTARRVVAEGKIFLTLAKTEEFLCLDLKTGKEL